MLLVIALAAAAPGAQAKQVPSQWTWTDYGPALRDVSCGSPGDCVAVGQRGMVFRTTSDADNPLAWARIPLEYPKELDGVACTKAFCLAVSNTRLTPATFTSEVFRSTDGGATWSAGVPLPAAANKTRSALGIACDPAAQPDCYAVGPGGGVWRSLDQGLSWEALPQPKVPGAYSRVACPAAGVCVAVGGEGAVSSAVIEGTTVTPEQLPAGAGKSMLGLACDSATRCTATDGLGNYMSITFPSKTWGPARLFPRIPKKTAVTSLSCPRADTCVGLVGGIAMRTTSLSAPDGGWHRRPDGSLNLAQINCVGDDCVAVGKAAAWYKGEETGSDWRRVNEVPKLDAIQCPAADAGTCVAGGEKDIGVSRSEGELWSEPLSGVTGLNIKSVECSGHSECLFLGKTETLFTDDLIEFKERHPTITDPRGTDALTCITKEVCVGINEGVVYTTFDGAVTPWSQNAFPDKATSVACIHNHLDPVQCVATTREFLILGTMTHADGKVRWTWRYTDADPPLGLEAVGCSPGGQCTAVGAGGELLTSNGTDLMHWSELTLPNTTEPVATRPLLKSVACPADGQCLVGGIHGPDAVIAATTNNWAEFSYEKIQGIEGAAPTITAFGCESADRCVAVGSTSLVGERKNP
jgi:photosystem II stability/assembly factor-like uncharacterized protein